MSREQPALFRRFARARAAIPWLPLGDLPTPVQPLEGLRERVAPAAIRVKRDDLSSPLYGGNKVRALEFLLADALARRAEGILVTGALGSHFVCAAALFARQAGLHAEAFLWRQPPSDRCAETLGLLAHLGVPVRCYARPEAALAALLLFGWLQRLRGRRVAAFPPGGASPVGALGSVDLAFELAEQVTAGELPAPDSVWVACGSGGSAAGLALGLQLAGIPTRVRAVRVTPRIICNRARLSRLAAAAWGVLRGARADGTGDGGRGTSPDPPPSPVPRPPSLARLEIIEGYYAPGYAVSSAAAEDAAGVLRAQGLVADTTYTGRAMAALLDYAPREGGTHLFWHTLSSAGPPQPPCFRHNQN